jgi:pimeloyl-ACP methyl ester carboxylesterase
VILWNYRGYGQSTGSPSIRLSQVDATKVYGYYRQLGYEIEIVHGYSIGGAAAVGLVEEAEKTDNGVKMLIVDRSFSSIGEVNILEVRCRYSLGIHFID